LTSDNEGTPVCLIEAMAAGRAVVATDVGGVGNVLENGRLGRMVPARDPEQLADAIASLIDDADLRAKYAESGRATAQVRFRVERLAADIARLYARLTTPNHEKRSVSVPVVR
jgi:glycosyltransferase involved in cell wall biosynthesis